MIHLILMCLCQDSTETRRIDFSFLEKFRPYLVEDHFKEMQENLRSVVGAYVTMSGYVYLRSGEEGDEVLIIKAPYDPRIASSVPPGRFNCVQIRFKQGTQPSDIRSGRFITVTGLFRLEHKKTVGMFNIEEAVEGDVATPSKVASYAPDPSGATKLVFAVLEQTKKANSNQSKTIEIPEIVKSYEGRWVSITGFLLARGAEEQVDQFTLSKNPFDICCLGLQPTVFDMVKVQLKQGSNLSNRLARVITISGRFAVKLERPEGYIRSLYTLEDAVEGIVPEPVSAKNESGTPSPWIFVIPLSAIFLVLGLLFLKRGTKAMLLILLPFILCMVENQSNASQDEITIGDVVLANNSKDPFMQGQALDKIRNAGAKAAPAIIEFVKKRGNNGLSLQGTEVLEAIKDPSMVDLLAELVWDKKFFWRPAAMWGFATQADKKYLKLFRDCLTDNLWGVRQSAIRGLEKLQDKESLPVIKKLLADEIYAVRAQAAKSIYAFGDDTGLPILIAALRDETMWFDIDYGAIAREDAWNFLKQLTKDDFGFKPWQERSRREKGLVKWEEWIAKRFPKWQEMIPKTALFKQDDSKYIFGFELRSCQLGDYFFRLDKAGFLSLGCFNVTKAKLSEEEIKGFNEAAKGLYKIDPEGVYGRPGCDIEKYYLLSNDGGLETRLLFIAGRPSPCDKFIEAARTLIQKHFGDGSANEFKELTNLFREQTSTPDK